MSIEGAFGLGLALPGIKRVVEEQGEEAKRQIADACILLDILGRGAARLGRRLHQEGHPGLAAPVSLVATVTRKKFHWAVEREWLPKSSHGLYGWDPTRQWSSMTAPEAVEALCDELRNTAMSILGAVDFVPVQWEAGLCDCVASVLMVSAQLLEALHGRGGKPNREVERRRELACATV